MWKRPKTYKIFDVCFFFLPFLLSRYSDHIYDLLLTISFRSTIMHAMHIPSYSLPVWRSLGIYQRYHGLSPQIYTINQVYILNLKDPPSFLIQQMHSLDQGLNWWTLYPEADEIPMCQRVFLTNEYLFEFQSFKIT